MISEAPLRTVVPHVILLEKMLVDLSSDKMISTTYSKAEFPDAIEQAQSQYLIDEVRMLRYTRRRNRGEVLKSILKAARQIMLLHEKAVS
ncbi:hypothetical protein D7V94_05745 [Parablautia intestinalis]|uniref:Uncharacterized protein n=2 Tax=Parablautia intestinalis TaxID=2320100 RepID=A0A3A9AML8_9FIRM|nr:hypothetical protein D7V94_05745 [Parablautia intestinalis]